jgi:hypothetical protein
MYKSIDWKKKYDSPGCLVPVAETGVFFDPDHDVDAVSPDLAVSLQPPLEPGSPGVSILPPVSWAFVSKFLI